MVHTLSQAWDPIFERGRGSTPRGVTDRRMRMMRGGLSTQGPLHPSTVGTGSSAEATPLDDTAAPEG